MATIHLAMDAETGLALPLGTIKGLSESVQGLRDAGFAADPYTGTRLTTIDDTAAGWNHDVQPGWKLLTRASATAYTLGAVIPPTDLDDLQDAIKAFQAQVVAWSRDLIHRGVAQPRAKVEQGHDRLYSALGAVYLVARNASHTAANRKIWVANLTTGAQDIRKVDDFYSSDTGSFAEPPARGTAGDWYAWVNIANPSVKLALTSSVAVTGIIPANVDLLDPDWVDAITS